MARTDRSTFWTDCIQEDNLLAYEMTQKLVLRYAHLFTSSNGISLTIGMPIDLPPLYRQSMGGICHSLI